MISMYIRTNVELLANESTSTCRLVGEAIVLDEKGLHRQALEEYGRGV